jgi:phospholipid transport system substrate-binding protein
MNTRWKKNGLLIYRSLLPLFILLVALFMPFPIKAEQNGPSEVIKKLNAGLLEAMKGGRELGYGGRFRLLAPVIKDTFALYKMARLAAGKYWETFSEEERNVYLKTYTEWSIASYAGRFNKYDGERFTLVSESAPERSTVTVISKLVESNKDEVEFNYLLRRVEGAWRVVDIRVFGVSQLALTRVQFVSILGKMGLQGLISMLNEKISDLSQGKGS